MTRGRRLSTLADGTFGAAPWWLRGLIAVQVVAILGLAVTVSLRARLLIGPDEAANVSYVQILAEQHRLPVEDRDCLSTALQRLQSPAPPKPCRQITGTSYEAFQPPLYY